MPTSLGPLTTLVVDTNYPATQPHTVGAFPMDATRSAVITGSTDASSIPNVTTYTVWIVDRTSTAPVLGQSFAIGDFIPTQFLTWGETGGVLLSKNARFATVTWIWWDAGVGGFESVSHTLPLCTVDSSNFQMMRFDANTVAITAAMFSTVTNNSTTVPSSCVMVSACVRRDPTTNAVTDTGWQTLPTGYLAGLCGAGIDGAIVLGKAVLIPGTGGVQFSNTVDVFYSDPATFTGAFVVATNATTALPGAGRIQYFGGIGYDMQSYGDSGPGYFRVLTGLPITETFFVDCIISTCFFDLPSGSITTPSSNSTLDTEYMFYDNVNDVWPQLLLAPGGDMYLAILGNLATIGETNHLPDVFWMQPPSSTAVVEADYALDQFTRSVIGPTGGLFTDVGFPLVSTAGGIPVGWAGTFIDDNGDTGAVVAWQPITAPPTIQDFDTSAYQIQTRPSVKLIPAIAPRAVL